jgi:hypothetical protein
LEESGKKASRSNQMNKPILLLAGVAALAATAALAQTPQPAPAPGGTATAKSGTSASTKMVCRSQGDSSSRLRRQRVCVTQAEWDEQRRLSRADVEKAQTSRSWCENGAC